MSVVIRDMNKADRCEDCRLLQTYQEHPFASVEMWCGVTDETIDNMQKILPNCPITEISEYTMKNGHKVVVADAPQTDCAVITDTSYQVLDGWQTREKPKTTDCGWK